MNNFNDMWSNAEAPDRNLKKIPNGKYIAKLTDAKLDMSKDPYKVSLEYTITGADLPHQPNEYAGYKAWQNYQMKPPGIAYLKKDLETLGLNSSTVSRPEDIGDFLGQCIGAVCDVYIKTNPSKTDPSKSFTNVFLNDVVNNAQMFDTNEEIQF